MDQAKITLKKIGIGSFLLLMCFDIDDDSDFRFHEIILKMKY